MQLTIKDAIKAIPISEETRNDLLARFDSLSHGEQFEITKIVWDTYYALQEEKADMKFEIALREILAGKRNAQPNLYESIAEEVQKESMKEFESDVKEDELTEVRNKLKSLVTSDI